MIAQINEDYLRGIQLWTTTVTKRIDTPCDVNAKKTRSRMMDTEITNNGKEL